jgi:hypothetical protein
MFIQRGNVHPQRLNVQVLIAPIPIPMPNTSTPFDFAQGKSLSTSAQCPMPPTFYQGTTPFSSKNPPLEPSSGKVASLTAAIAPCSTLRSPWY